MPKLDPKALKEARKGKHWTRRHLSDATKINISTIFRLESGKSESVRERTLRELAKALEVDTSELCPASATRQTLLKVDIDYAARNALTLVAHRYGVSEENIVQVAPLLFYIAAEQNLKDRGRRVTELRAAAKTLSDIQAGISHFPQRAPVDETLISKEEKAIKDLDLIGESFFDEQGQFLEDSNIYAEDVQCPFTAFLRNSLATASGRQENLDAVSWGPESGMNGIPVYEICKEEAAQLVGGDEIATDAILSGFFLLDGLPKESPQELAALIRGERDRWQAEIDSGQADISEEIPEELRASSATENDTEHRLALTGGTIH
jgi:transcriptional regulator with XRE-family HTH domain